MRETDQQKDTNKKVRIHILKYIKSTTLRYHGMLYKGLDSIYVFKKEYDNGRLTFPPVPQYPLWVSFGVRQ